MINWGPQLTMNKLSEIEKKSKLWLKQNLPRKNTTKALDMLENKNSGIYNLLGIFLQFVSDF